MTVDKCFLDYVVHRWIARHYLAGGGYSVEQAVTNWRRYLESVAGPSTGHSVICREWYADFRREVAG